MKKNNKGFSLLETLIVSTFIVGTLIYLYTQISNVKTSYDVSFRYNTISGLFSAKNISSYLKENDYTAFENSLRSTSNGFIEIQSSYLGNRDYYKKLIEVMNIKKILFVSSDLTNLKGKINLCYNSNTADDGAICLQSEEMKKFIKNLDSAPSSRDYRLVIEFNDNTFSSIEMG